MLTTDGLRALIAGGESDRVEFAVSTTNTDKFGEAICAFANDFPDHGQPGRLVVGVDDVGTVGGLAVTDDLLKRLGALRSNVNLEPLPAMTVQSTRCRTATWPSSRSCRPICPPFATRAGSGFASVRPAVARISRKSAF